MPTQDEQDDELVQVRQGREELQGRQLSETARSSKRRSGGQVQVELGRRDCGWFCTPMQERQVDELRQVAHRDGQAVISDEKQIYIERDTQSVIMWV